LLEKIHKKVWAGDIAPCVQSSVHKEKKKSKKGRFLCP
jgi:hypothetical protein